MLREVPIRMYSSLTERMDVLRGKLSSRCFHWFPAAMLESLRVGLQHGVSILNTIILSDIFCRITRVRYIAHPQNLGMFFYLLLLYDISISCLIY